MCLWIFGSIRNILVASLNIPSYQSCKIFLPSFFPPFKFIFPESCEMLYPFGRYLHVLFKKSSLTNIGRTLWPPKDSWSLLSPWIIIKLDIFFSQCRSFPLCVGPSRRGIKDFRSLGYYSLRSMQEMIPTALKH